MKTRVVAPYGVFYHKPIVIVCFQGHTCEITKPVRAIEVVYGDASGGSMLMSRLVTHISSLLYNCIDILYFRKVRQPLGENNVQTDRGEVAQLIWNEASLKLWYHHALLPCGLHTKLQPPSWESQSTRRSSGTTALSSTKGRT